MGSGGGSGGGAGGGGAISAGTKQSKWVLMVKRPKGYLSNCSGNTGGV